MGLNPPHTNLNPPQIGTVISFSTRTSLHRVPLCDAFSHRSCCSSACRDPRPPLPLVLSFPSRRLQTQPVLPAAVKGWSMQVIAIWHAS